MVTVHNDDDEQKPFPSPPHTPSQGTSRFFDNAAAKAPASSIWSESHTRAGSSHTTIRIIPPEPQDAKMTPEDEAWFKKSPPPNYGTPWAIPDEDPMPPLEDADTHHLHGAHHWFDEPAYEEGDKWWSATELFVRKPPGEGLLPVLAAEEVHTSDHELLKIDVTPPDIRAAELAEVPADFKPPTADEVRAAIPHQNAYFCRQCNGWMIIQRSKLSQPPVELDRGGLDALLGRVPALAVRLPRRRELVGGIPECSKRVDETWNHRPKQTHHFHRYHGVVSAARLNPPFLRPSWEYKAAPMPPLVQELDAQSFPEPRVTFLAWKYPSIKVTPPPTDHGCDVDWLDIYMCCECPVNIMATRSPIPGVVPRRLLDDLIRERMSVGAGNQLYVVLALETILKAIERVVWHGDRRSINPDGPGFVNNFGKDAQARQIFDTLGFSVNSETNRLNPPEFSTEQERGVLLRAWLEISAIALDWIRRFPQPCKARDTPGPKFWVKISPERDQVLEMMGAHPNQIPRGHIEVPQHNYDDTFKQLGLTQGSYTPELLEFAYNHQIQCDPQHTPLYFGALSLLINDILPTLKPESAIMNPDRDGLLTDSLQIMYTSERSKNRWSPHEFDEASSELRFGMDNDLKLDIEDVEPDFVGKAYTDAVARTYGAAHTMNAASWINTTSIDAVNERKRKSLRDALRIVAEGLGDAQLYELWKRSGQYGFMDPNKAYLTLDVPAETTDEMLMTVYQMRIQDAPSDLLKMKEAMEVIAETRNSTRLLTFVQSGIDTGDPLTVSRPEWPRGLNQLGNTCYLNSLLQYFYTIKELRDSIQIAKPTISDKDKSSGSKAYETDLVKFSDADIQKHRVGGRLVTRREIERSKKFLARLGELFFEMEFAENPAITPSLELAKLALVTSKDEEEDDANTSGSAQPRMVEASSSSPSTDATLVEEAAATAHNSHLHKPGGPSGLSSVVPAPAQPSSILGKRPREVDQPGDKTSESSSPAKPRSPRRDGSPPPDKTMRVEEPFHDVEMVVQSLQADEDVDTDMDNASDEAVAPDSVGGSPGAEILAIDDEGPTQEMIENATLPLEKAVPPPLPPRKAPVKTNESTMMFGKQHDVSECMDNCMFQIETALLKFDEQASTDSDKMSIVKRLFYGKMHQRITALPIEASSQGKATVNEKEDLISHLPVNVSDEGYDLYDGLGGYFYDMVEFEGKRAIMDVTLVELPPVLQIQLQRVQFNRETLQPYKSQAYIKFGETLYMDRFLDDAKPEKKAHAKEIQARLTMCRDRIQALMQSEGLAITDALMCTHDFFDRQTAMDIEGIDTDVLNVLSTEAELVKQELEAYRIEVAQLKQQQEELWQDEQTAEYELTSVFIHRGSSPSFGHYFFYARCLPNSPDEWFKYNDSDVSLVSKDEVLADTTGSTANPYLLVFARKGSGVVHTVNRSVIASESTK